MVATPSNHDEVSEQGASSASCLFLGLRAGFSSASDSALRLHKPGVPLDDRKAAYPLRAPQRYRDSRERFNRGDRARDCEATDAIAPTRQPSLRQSFLSEKRRAVSAAHF